MQGFRLVRDPHGVSPLDGEGARRVGGRWNVPGTPVAYCASRLSLAVLELLVHVEVENLPPDLTAVRIELPDDLPFRRLKREDLPGDWRRETGRAALRALGEAWVKEGATGVLVVPSVVIPTEENILINPAHGDSARIRILAREPFSLDPRLFRPGP